MARERTQTRLEPLPAALAVGGIWAGWHVPLYAIPGSFQHSLGFGSVESLLMLAGNFVLAVLLVWLVNGSGGRVLLAALAHALNNAAGQVLPATTWTRAAEFVLMVVFVLVMVRLSAGRLGLGGGRAAASRSRAAPAQPGEEHAADDPVRI